MFSVRGDVTVSPVPVSPRIASMSVNGSEMSGNSDPVSGVVGRFSGTGSGVVGGISGTGSTGTCEVSTTEVSIVEKSDGVSIGRGSLKAMFEVSVAKEPPSLLARSNV